jgi:hypothetical protein
MATSSAIGSNDSSTKKVAFPVSTVSFSTVFDLSEQDKKVEETTAMKKQNLLTLTEHYFYKNAENAEMRIPSAKFQNTTGIYIPY